ncbi:MAG: HAD-IA family hydrolase [Reyranella sp.]|uniref:HAD family hydrolase n=1 Tax=Reyranella sp. TaxID=1929291 RepID=UPI001ACEFACA|nr:HAD-IA family hydrolase [Reyranella sp.]MBN9090581.1 HAD-IA family hydrolase [Reyranella sp.]
MPEVLVLDAMGVLYQAGDDVAELLVPFVRRHGTANLSAEDIDRAYVAASLGRMELAEFWTRMGVDATCEDDYLAGHRLIDGTLDALPRLRARYGRLACLSNDVSQWSLKLRRQFGLAAWIDSWFISGDLGLRKPSPDIYRRAIADLGVTPQEIVFVDDRPRNLDAARDVGLQTVLLDIGGKATSPHRTIRSLAELV